MAINEIGSEKHIQALTAMDTSYLLERLDVLLREIHENGLDPIEVWRQSDEARLIVSVLRKRLD